MEKKDRFLLLRKIRYGDADLIVQALSPRGEKVSFMARGALSSKKRFGGGILEPGHLVQVTFREHGEGRMRAMIEATLINDFPGLRSDYDRLDFALRVLEAVNRVSQEGDSTSEFLFNLLGHTLKTVAAGRDLDALRLQFWLKFLLQQGVLTPDDWMAPFLRARIEEADMLIDAAKGEAARLPGLEKLVDEYLRTATVSLS